MPIYEYACSNCGHELEVIQKMSDVPLQQCPACDENTLKKLISAAGFRLKGSGWYETDFKNKGRNEKKPKKEVEETTTTTSSTTCGEGACSACTH